MDARVPFVLTMVGACIAGGIALMMAIVFSFLAITFGDAGGAAFFLAIMTWLVVGSLAGGVAMLVGALRMRRPESARSGATWAIVGGAIAIVGGNLLGGGLGIAGGAILLASPAPVTPHA